MKLVLRYNRYLNFLTTLSTIKKKLMLKKLFKLIFPCPEKQVEEITTEEQHSLVQIHTNMIMTGLRGFSDPATRIENQKTIYYTMSILYNKAFRHGMDMGYQTKEQELIQLEHDPGSLQDLHPL